MAFSKCWIAWSKLRRSYHNCLPLKYSSKATGLLVLAETYVIIPTYTDNFSYQSIHSKAIQALNKSLQLNPNGAEALTAKARLYFKFEQKWDEAMALFEKAIDINPNHAFAHFWFGVLLQVMNQPEKAKERHLKALELEPRWALFHYNLGVVYLRLDDVVSAEESFKSAMLLQPNWFFNDQAQFFLALKKKNYLKALGFWKKYKERWCEQFICEEQDVSIPIDIITNLAQDKGLTNSVRIEKIRTLNSFEDRLLFAALVNAKEIVYSELSNMVDENNYLFTQEIRMFYLDKFRDDPEFKVVLRAANQLEE